MSGIFANLKSRIAQHQYSAVVPYLGAVLAVWVALSLWTFSPVLHRHIFALLLAGVLFTARFLGFGPAVFSALVSSVCFDFFGLPPYHSLHISTAHDLERLLARISLDSAGPRDVRALAASLARLPGLRVALEAMKATRPGVYEFQLAAVAFRCVQGVAAGGFRNRTIGFGLRGLELRSTLAHDQRIDWLLFGVAVDR